MYEIILEMFGTSHEELTAAIVGKIVATIGLIIYGLIKGLKFVNEGEEGVRLRFGKAVRNKNGVVKIIKPGLIVIIPFVENLRKRHVRQQTIQFNNVQVVVENLPFIVDASLIFKVKDIYKALFEVNDLESNIEDFGSHVLYSVISKLKEDQIYELDNISEKLLKNIKEKADEWGIEFIFFNLNSIRPTSETAEYMTIGPVVKARLSALQDAQTKLESMSINPMLAAALVGHQVTPVINESTRVVMKAKDKKWYLLTFNHKIKGFFYFLIYIQFF